MLIRKSEGWPFAGPPTAPIELNTASSHAIGLIAAWPFISDIQDASEYQHHLTEFHHIGYSFDPQVGRGINLNAASGTGLGGRNTEILRSASRELTVNIWYRPNPNTSDSWASIVAQPYNTNVTWGNPFYSWDIIRNGANDFVMCGLTTNPGINQTISLTTGFVHNVLYMVTLRFASQQLSGYVNGVLNVGPTSMNEPTISYHSSTPRFTIGNRSFDAPGERFGGTVYDVRIWNRALSNNEIWQLYDPQTRWELYRPLEPRFIVVVPEVSGDLSISVSDTIALSETVTVTVSAPQVSVSDTISLADNAAARLQSFVSVSDNIALSDNAQAVLVNLISVLDTISLSDNATARLQSFITALDTISLSDNAQALIESLITALDTITLADAPTVSVAEAGAIAINVTDTIALSETVTVAISDPQVSVLDTIAISDAPTVVVGVLGDLTILTIDTIAISDNVDVNALIEIDVSPLNEFYLVKGVAIV